MTAIRARGETPFSEAGDGVVLCFRNSDLKKIEAEFGPTWFQEMIDTFLKGVPSIAFIDAMVKAGIKKDGQPFEVDEAVLDAIPVHDVGDKIFDAACISMKGMPAKEYLEETFKAYAEAEASGESPPAPNPDSTFSTLSGESGSGQDSPSATSGESPPAKPKNTSTKSSEAT